MTTRSPAFASIPESIQWSPPLRETSCVRRSFPPGAPSWAFDGDRKSTRLNSSHDQISYAVFCLKKKKKKEQYRSENKCIYRQYTYHHMSTTQLLCTKGLKCPPATILALDVNDLRPSHSPHEYTP